MSKHSINGTISVDDLSITNEPYRGRVTSIKSKYEAFFLQMQPGQRLKCKKGTAARIGSQYKKWLTSRHGVKAPLVRCVEDYGDGFGGVWWIKEEAKPKTVLAANAPWPGLIQNTKKTA